MDSILGAEGSLIVRFVVAFVIVLALIGITFWLVRRFGGARVGAAAQRGRQPRLAVIDAAPIDGRRRLVLVRRDNVEHLLMIGGPSDVVVEQNIVRAVPVNAPRDMPVPRAASPENARSSDVARPQPFDDDNWTPPEPPSRPAFARPESLGRPEPLARPPRPLPRNLAAFPACRAHAAADQCRPPNLPPTLPPHRMQRSPAWRSASRRLCAAPARRESALPRRRDPPPRPISARPSRRRQRRTLPAPRMRKAASRRPSSTVSKRKWRTCSAVRPRRHSRIFQSRVPSRELSRAAAR